MNLETPTNLLTGCEIRDSDTENIHFRFSSLARLSISQRSRLNGIEGINCTLRDMQLSQTAITNLRARDLDIRECSARRFLLEHSVLNHVEIQGVSLEDCRVQQCSIDGYHLSQSAISRSAFERVKFVCSIPSYLRQMAIEDCAFSAGEFINCRFANVVLRQVRATGFRAVNVDFIEREIVGTDAFFAIPGVMAI